MDAVEDVARVVEDYSNKTQKELAADNIDTAPQEYCCPHHHCVI